MRALLVLAIVAAALVGAGDAAAQPRGDRGGGPMVAQDRREAVKKKIRVLRAATLTDELNLDEKALSRLLPVLSKWDDVTEDLLKKRLDIQRRLTAVDGTKDPKGVDKLIDEAVVNQKAFWDLEDRRLAELRRILTPAQIARLIIVLPAFERRIHNQLRRAINRGTVRGTRGAAERETDDDELDADDDELQPRRR